MRALFGIGGLADDLLAQPVDRTVLSLTSIFLVSTSRIFFAWHPLSIVAAALGVLMLLSPRLLTNRWAWAAVFAVLAWGLVAHWPTSENNRYLDAYWVLACSLALGFPQAEAQRLLARNGRLLIGLTFTLAASRKALRGGYWDGSFMHGLVLWDDRFRSIALLFGGIEAKDLLANAQLKNALVQMPAAVESISLITSDALRLYAVFLGYAVLAVGAAVGLSFLLPGPRWFVRWRNHFLFLFVLPTYLLAQVSHFGMMLTVMGYAQCPAERRGLRLTYLLLFVFLCFADMTGPLIVGTIMTRLA